MFILASFKSSRSMNVYEEIVDVLDLLVELTAELRISSFFMLLGIFDRSVLESPLTLIWV